MDQTTERIASVDDTGSICRDTQFGTDGEYFRVFELVAVEVENFQCASRVIQISAGQFLQGVTVLHFMKNLVGPRRNGVTCGGEAAFGSRVGWP